MSSESPESPIDPTERIEGPYGTAEYIDYPARDECDNVRSAAACDMARGTWLITAPTYHPLWSQYCMSIIALGEHDDLPPAKIKFEGATHELLVVSINPEKGTQTPETVREHCKRGTLPYMTPVDVAHQFECTDEEIRAVAWLAARAVTQGQLTPEVGNGPSYFRMQWLEACTKALAHLRGEAHAH